MGMFQPIDPPRPDRRPSAPMLVVRNGKLDPEVRSAAFDVMQHALVRAAMMHAKLVAQANVILDRLAPSADKPLGEAATKADAIILQAAEKSGEVIFNRVLGKCESTLNVKNDAGAEAFVKIFRSMVGNAISGEITKKTDEHILDVEIVRPAKTVETLKGAADICAARSPGRAEPLPSAQNFPQTSCEPEQLK